MSKTFRTKQNRWEESGDYYDDHREDFRRREMIRRIKEKNLETQTDNDEKVIK